MDNQNPRQATFSAASLIESGRASFGGKRYDDARFIYQRALQKVRELGPDSMDEARILNCLAESYVQEKDNTRDPRAVAFYEKALAVLDKILGRVSLHFQSKMFFTFAHWIA